MSRCSERCCAATWTLRTMPSATNEMATTNRESAHECCCIISSAVRIGLVDVDCQSRGALGHAAALSVFRHRVASRSEGGMLTRMVTSRLSLFRCVLACVPGLFGAGLEGLQRGEAPTTLFEGARLIVGDGSAPIENSAFLVDGETFTWVGKKGERQPSSGTRRVDLTGKTVIPALIDGHNHIGLVNERDGSNSKANYTRENLIDQLERYAYYGVAAALSMGLEADQELAFDLRDAVLPGTARFLTVGKGIAGSPIAGPPGEPRLGIPAWARDDAEGET